ncbi:MULTISPECIES: G/U mismatch-specific DNA glycosylase [Chryseobacterium]|uniref:G/U mismatch-specific DNA glycosylase n=1 Tax=Chryseobacterium TaxID=59732 RepID=UPI000787B6E1|nr:MULTISPECIES: G/U mismatch-specific DNA glycosylase [Chryseobacterium]KYH07215.1 mismatch-specific DNA-glycosylase [Chryseobacterium cucumeris]MDH5033225.1 G/U mismatch-specific DNA glycosylase [Chryseobacterium cucumeris]QWT86833.1 G/U mismatch-specific DNA glycosylase [Chryseobacterium sp. PCH239]RKE81492.1 G/U mismatch-specific uracil-DNA glycosylase [Chryseobacterium sp. AG363]WFB68539.1 G/U mismatch-specific DNA glycosylase [Chryseobacterium sp. WX]
MLTDIISTHLNIIFCGINPGLKSSNDGHHFSGRSNRFWKVLHQAGFTSYEIEAVNDTSLLDFGYGLTTAVARATSRADELSKEEFDESLESFKLKITKYQPKYIAFLGKAAYKAFSKKKEILWGEQSEDFCGAKVWVLPNTSGLNRGFSLDSLVMYYKEFYHSVHES